MSLNTQLPPIKSTRLVLQKQGITEFLMTLVFMASFAPYVAGITTGTLLIGPASLLIISLSVLFFLYPERFRELGLSFIRPRLVILAYVFPLVSCVISLSKGEWNSFSYSVLMGLVLMACQVMLSVVSIDRLLLSFAQAGAVAIATFWITDWHGIFYSAATSTRLLPSHTHPNTIGFIFAGFAGLFLWRILDRRLYLASRGLYFALFCAASGTIFLAQSRASMLAIVCAVIWIAVLAITRASQGKPVYVRYAIIILVVVMFGGIIAMVAKPSYLDEGASYLTRVLHIDTRSRGIGSDLSGRIPRWKTAVSALAENGRWAIGSGYRSSLKRLGFSIDNGYLTIWYEGGLFLLLFTAGQLTWCVWITSKRYLEERDNQRRWVFAALGSTIIIFLINNIFDRYLLGIGNPFSLLGLFILLMRRRDFVFTTHKLRTERLAQRDNAKELIKGADNGKIYTYS